MSNYSHSLIGFYLWSIGGQTHIDDVINIFLTFFTVIKQIDSMLPCICSVIDHRRRQNVVRPSEQEHQWHTVDTWVLPCGDPY